jgi:Na+/H+ antiporter NhaA
MAIFVDGLAFLPSGLSAEMISYYVNLGKAVILLTSVTAAVVGAVSLYVTTKDNDNIENKM